MKKKIIITVFSLIILITVVTLVVGAIASYNYDVKNYPNDKMPGFGAVLVIIVGGFLVFYELDLFYTVYYFLIKPKTLARSVLNIASNLTLLTVFFSGAIGKFLSKWFNIFKEDWLFPIFLIFVYVILRTVFAMLSLGESE